MLVAVLLLLLLPRLLSTRWIHFCSEPQTFTWGSAGQQFGHDAAVHRSHCLFCLPGPTAAIMLVVTTGVSQLAPRMIGS
jgi:hypothetical protein